MGMKISAQLSCSTFGLSREMIMDLFPNLVWVNNSKNIWQDGLGQSWLKPRKQDLVFICWINNSRGTIIFKEKSWRYHKINNKPVRFMRLNSRFNLLLPNKIIGITKFFVYGVWKKLGRGWEGAWIDHCGSITGSWYHNTIWYVKDRKKEIQYYFIHNCIVKENQYIALRIKSIYSSNKTRNKNSRKQQTAKHFVENS